MAWYAELTCEASRGKGEMSELSQRQRKIISRMSDAGWNGTKINYELPAMEAVNAVLESDELPTYSSNNPPPKGSYLFHQGQIRPQRANALVQNLGQRIALNLRPVASQLYFKDSVEVTQAIAEGAQAIDQTKSFYDQMGLLKDLYIGEDIVESRYAASAQLYAKFLMEEASSSLSSMGTEGDGNPQMNTADAEEYDGDPNMQAEIKKFAKWVATLEPYMRIISKYIDKTIGAPTQRIKKTKTQDPEGDEVDIVDLDIMQMNRMTYDSLATFAVDRKWATLNLDNMTMEERYTTMTKKYIDVFVVDNSGSMDGHIFRAASYLWNRLDKVVKGWAMLAIVEFTTGASVIQLPESIAQGKPRWLIDTPEKAKWAMENIIMRYANFTGGGTDIPAGVREGIKLSQKMEEEFNGHKPNITVITDDDTSIAMMNPKDTSGIPVNGLALSENTPLQNFCIQTGGTYYNLDQIEMNLDTIRMEMGGE